MISQNRGPAVSGLFYPGKRDSLLSMISEMDIGSQVPHYTGILGVVVPHAGYVYSGKTAMKGFDAIRHTESRNFVLIGPNHDSYPFHTSIYPEGVWETPLGGARVNRSISRELLDANPDLVADPDAHVREHSLEVEVPFLQYIFGEDFTITPIIMGNQSIEMARSVANSLKSVREDFTLIISSDLTHYESRDSVNRKDSFLIEEVLSLDVEEYYRTVEKYGISACGYGAIAVLMEYTRMMKGEMEVLGHSTSYDYSGDARNVVGYCSLISHRK